jgi:hypothetical protein
LLIDGCSIHAKQVFYRYGRLLGIQQQKRLFAVVQGRIEHTPCVGDRPDLRHLALGDRIEEGLRLLE